MGRSIAAAHRWTADDLAESGRVHMRQSRGPVARGVLHVLSLTSIGPVADSSRGFVRSHWADLAGMVPLSVVILSTFAFIDVGVYANRLLGRLTFRIMPDHVKDVKWTLTVEGLPSRTPLASTASGWEDANVHDWIPGPALASSMVVRTFARMAEELAPKYIMLGECETTDLAHLEPDLAR